jgi:indole-3-glycerol phosphate synthase
MERALGTGAAIVGVNARDLRTFRVDPALARRCLEVVPDDRVAVFMSGVKDRSDLDAVAEGRADAVLVGEGLMRASDPEDTLRRWLDPDISATPAAC